MELIPINEHEYVGRMWVIMPDGRCFPKYPLALSVLVAIIIKLGGEGAVYWISPVCMIFALLAVFFMARHIGGLFAGILCMLMLASTRLFALGARPSLAERARRRRPSGS
jgi:hypothetical protein